MEQQNNSQLTTVVIFQTIFVCSVIPVSLIVLYLHGLILISTLKICLVLFVVIFVVIPVIFKFSYPFQRAVLYLNFVNIPKDPDFNVPEKYGVEGARNLYVTTDNNVTLGIWQILPSNLINATKNRDKFYFDSVLNNGQPIVLYLHGNAGHRAASHRIPLYLLLRKYFHVFTFDYRSYGDSTNVEPDETGLVNDAKFMLEWVKNKTDAPVFAWGHSLGTGILTHALDVLWNTKGFKVSGVILESPFNNLRDEIREHPLAKPFKDLPWFDYLIVTPMQDNDMKFASDKHILNFNAPILILHAVDDGTVPYKLGYKLYKTGNESRGSEQGTVSFQRYESKYGYGHKWICKAPETPEVILSFLKRNVGEPTLSIINSNL